MARQTTVRSKSRCAGGPGAVRASWRSCWTALRCPASPSGEAVAVPAEQWFTTEDVAQSWQVPPRFVRTLIRRGELRAVNFGSSRKPRYRVSRRDVEEFEQSRLTWSEPVGTPLRGSAVQRPSKRLVSEPGAYPEISHVVWRLRDDGTRMLDQPPLIRHDLDCLHFKRWDRQTTHQFEAATEDQLRMLPACGSCMRQRRKSAPGAGRPPRRVTG
ncbi:helix-turn-helix domain-containing protein [Friedmanniella luteola]|uniref:helix-turn-helix domain-containing protein n=1 Tax=Friedmanniella luteola TaxID=546871 RepID=UPI000B82176C